MEKKDLNLQNFGKEFSGKLILPEDREYDEARRLWNGLYDKYPAGIAKCRNSKDVVQAVNFVKDNNIKFSVRGGGHDYAGNSVCDDGLVIDLSLMNSVEVNAGNRTAKVE